MRIGIIGAMDEEVELLKSQIQHRSKTNIAGSEIFTGTIDDVDVVLLKSGIGKVNAAIAATLLLQLYKPDYVINTGSAGGFHQDLNVGDIVVSTEVRYHDVDVTVFGYEYGQVPQMPPFYEADPALIELAERCAGKVSDKQIVKGQIATADSFMSDAGRVAFVREKFPNLLAAEMEACAIAQTSTQFGVPFVIIRALSDIAGKSSEVSFEQFLHVASTNCANLIQSMIKEMKKHG
jgi:adenosylhomocysteine nucleosidase